MPSVGDVKDVTVVDVTAGDVIAGDVQGVNKHPMKPLV